MTDMDSDNNTGISQPPVILPVPEDNITGCQGTTSLGTAPPASSLLLGQAVRMN